MKAFPHQFNNLDRLTAALELLSLLEAQGKNPQDDGDYGSELALAWIYNFRNLETTIEERLELEKQKPSGDQGARTAARDMRRFFSLARLINSECELTDRGSEIVANKSLKPLRDALWREAMLDLKLADSDGNISHPYRVMLKLVGSHPGIETKKLFLAFEAVDDSIEEFERVLSLSYLTFEKILDATKTTTSSAANAVKILPSIGEQVGDIQRGRKSFISTTTVVTEDGLDTSPNEEPSEDHQKAVEVSPDDIAKIPTFSDDADSAIFDLAAANAIRKKRTIKHQKAVTSLARLVSKSGFKVYENPYDCLCFKEGKGSILAEIKTLDGTSTDERRQSIKALGQIKSYSYFNVEKEMKAPQMIETVAYDQTPSQSTIAFLKENKVRSIWLNEDQWFTADDTGVTSLFLPDPFIAT